jgi:hypothetical protein
MAWGRRHPALRPRRRRFERVGQIFRVVYEILRLAWSFLRGRIRYLTFLGVVACALAAAIGGSTFHVNKVEVYGTLLLDRSAVAQAVGLAGQNPFLVNTSVAEQRAMALGVPEHVTISFVLPSTAVVHVVERRPAYIWKVDSTLYLVADDGTILGKTLGEHGRVVVVDLDRRPVKPGEKVDASALHEAAYLIAVLPRVSNLSPRFVFYSRDLGIVVPGPDGIQVAFGDDQHLESKLQALGPTLKIALAQKPRPALVDLQFADHPFFH